MTLKTHAIEGSNEGNRPRKAATSRDALNNRLFFRLFQAANIYETQAMWAFSTSAVQGAMLGALSRYPEGMPLAELCAYLAVSRQNTHVVLRRLEGAGFVERVEGVGDRRKRTVRLTEAGLEAWKDLRRRTVDFFRLGTRELSSEEVEACAETLARIGRALKAMRGG
ncbi:MarR family winged helix-turn-helix transcriptional regulator [Roseiarcus sp.]|uniref:MarR family winged helix-turn-helix transcriptional regulator n=1 Tax=Roseiarcus sp. TaxID=1969460 RepID=UPI003F9C22AA